MFTRLLLCIFAFCYVLPAGAQSIYEVRKGSISFHSDAPQELIRASSDKLQGVFDVSKKTFAFRIDIVSFIGFNSPLQREHFNENYMETSIYPRALFVGKVIEDTDLSKDGEYTVRAKGKLKIHGLERERIINVRINVSGKKILVRSDFVVLLADHDIKIPRVVYDKLAPEINVSVNAQLLPK
ncbi:MAG: YceI family protein [Sphingobacteriales bacterium]|nr:MAG: YceI family protein [Sphingobacteriales bacterium]